MVTPGQISRELAQIHGAQQAYFTGIERLAVALYNEQTDKRETVVHSTTHQRRSVRCDRTASPRPSSNRSEEVVRFSRAKAGSFLTSVEATPSAAQGAISMVGSNSRYSGR